MKLSYIVGVLDSHEMVRRQLIYWKGLDLPDSIEIILVDDGSEPPLEFPNHGVKNLRIHATNDKRLWTYALARNAGARLSESDYMLFTDMDHILPRETLIASSEFTGERMLFSREFAVLDENGKITQDHAVLRDYGLLDEWIDKAKLKAPLHWDSFLIRRDLFWLAGGYNENDAFKHPPMGETHFRAAYRSLNRTTSSYYPLIYLVPNGQYCGNIDYNPHGLFHSQSRMSRQNAKLQRALDARNRCASL